MDYTQISSSDTVIESSDGRYWLVDPATNTLAPFLIRKKDGTYYAVWNVCPRFAMAEFSRRWDLKRVITGEEFIGEHFEKFL